MTAPEFAHRAPLLRDDCDPGARRLLAAYGVWREHYEVCAVCNRQEWAHPVVTALCTTGREAFRGWARLSMLLPPSRVIK